MEYNLSLFVFFVFEKIEVKGVYGRRTREVRLDRKKSAEFGSFRNRGCPTFSDRTRSTRAQYIWKLLNSNFSRKLCE